MVSLPSTQVILLKPVLCLLLSRKRKTRILLFGIISEDQFILQQEIISKLLSAFLGAYYLMNDTSAFSHLESRAVSLTGEEREKAYKGDPYERVYNSLYVALLLEQEHDYDNALAAVKNGILCDSDVEGGLYKSDVTLLYLLAARLEILHNNQSMSDEYFKKHKRHTFLAYPINRYVVSDEQGKLNLLGQKQKELEKLMSKQAPSKPKKEEKDKKKDRWLQRVQFRIFLQKEKMIIQPVLLRNQRKSYRSKQKSKRLKQLLQH